MRYLFDIQQEVEDGSGIHELEISGSLNSAYLQSTGTDPSTRYLEGFRAVKKVKGL